MTPNLQITAFGSHTSTTLALLGHPGVVTVSGASGVGKSLLIDAIVFALVGTQRDGKTFDVRAIRNGADKCEVKAEIGGHRVKASVTRAGSWTRAVDGVSDPATARHHAALGIDGRADVVGTEAWAPGNRKVTAAALSARALDGYADDPADTVTYVVLGEGGYTESGPYTCTYDKWLEWVEGPGWRTWICNEEAA